MATVPPSPTLPESRRLSIRVPHWSWFLLAAIVMIVASVGLSVWLPYHRAQQAYQQAYLREQQTYLQEQKVKREIKRWGGTVGTETGGAESLRQLASKDPMSRA